MAKKILLADDSITIQKVVELTFSDGDYEVVAVNNGARAIQKLQEFRPDIILSDIIMPEKNGYEVCEFVKSHPDFRAIPVVLLTGTFEPFDPDRAERAGCDAVVTKPFESQSLIHKVDELIASSGPRPTEQQAPPPSPFDETAVERRPSREMPVEPQSQEAAPSPGAFDAVDEPDTSDAGEPFGESAPASPEEIFGATEPPAEPRDQPFEDSASPFASEAAEQPGWPQEPATGSLELGGEQAEETPVKEQTWSAETTAIPKMSFGDLPSEIAQREQSAGEPETSAPAKEDVWSSATTAFPKMSFDDLRKAAEAGSQEAETAPSAEEPAWSAETTAIPKMTFEDLPRPQESEPPPPSQPEPLPWETAAPQAPEESGFEWPRSAPSPAEESASAFESAMDGESIPYEPISAPAEGADEWPSQPAPPADPWVETPSSSSFEVPASSGAPFEEPADEEAVSEEAAEPAEEETPSQSATESEEPLIAAGPEEAPAAAAAPASAAAAAALSDEDVDRIARRVVELLSDRAVREIAWEVIPDIAASVVRDRIRELETAD